MNEGLDFDDVLIVPTATDIRSRKDVNLRRTFDFRNGVSWTITPIVASNMHGIGTSRVAKILGQYLMPAALVKGLSVQTNEQRDEFENVFMQEDSDPIPTFGLDIVYEYDTLEELSKLVDYPVICLDVANGYMDMFVNTVEIVKNNFPNIIIIAGNVATGQGAYNLFKAGADIVKVGIGPGLACSTRFKTGVGIPQITAIQEASTVAKSFEKRYVMADGGCKTPGDIAKAFVAGADLVMIGGMLAGHKETVPVLYGSSSWRAMGENGISKEDVPYRTSEGIEVDIPSRGSLRDTIDDILGGLRSTCSYTNCENIQELKKAQFIKVNRVK